MKSLYELSVIVQILQISTIVSSAYSYVSGKNSNSFFGDKEEWSVSESTKGRAKPGELIFQEEFNSLNLDIWSHEISLGGGGNGEFQIYTNNRSNSYVKYGMLYLKPTLTTDKYGDDFLTSGVLQLGGGAPGDKCTDAAYEGCMREGSSRNIINPAMSARLRSVNSFSFKYGRVEVRAKMPSGDWLWPGIWLLPQKNQYGSWPASGEIDILEGRGNKNLYDVDGIHIGVEQVAQTLHFGPYHKLNAWEKTHFEKNSEEGHGFNENFHLYQLEWTPEKIKFSIDGEDVAAILPSSDGFWSLGGFGDDLDNPWRYAENPKMAPFDQHFYFTLNLAVGGTNSYFPDSSKGNYNKPWKNSSPQAMKDFWSGRKNWYPSWTDEEAAFIIDYIRVWAL